MKTFGIMLFMFAVSGLSANICQASVSLVGSQIAWQNEFAAIEIADFEGFLGVVTNQYPNVTFSGFNGGSPHTLTQFPLQGLNSMFTVGANGGGGGWAVDFDSPVKGFAFLGGDVQFSGSTVALYEASHGLLGEYDIFLSGVGHGGYLYGFNGFISDSSDISRVEVSIMGSDAIWFDNVQYSAASTLIPAPGAILLASIGVGIVGYLRRRRTLR